MYKHKLLCVCVWSGLTYVLISVTPSLFIFLDSLCLTAGLVFVCVSHMLDGFFKQHQVHDSVQLIIMLQSISQRLLEFLPVCSLTGLEK